MKEAMWFPMGSTVLSEIYYNMEICVKQSCEIYDAKYYNNRSRMDQMTVFFFLQVMIVKISQCNSVR